MITITMGMLRREWHTFALWLDDRYGEDGWKFFGIEPTPTQVRKAVLSDECKNDPSDELCGGTIRIECYDDDRAREDQEFVLIKLFVNNAQTVGRYP